MDFLVHSLLEFLYSPFQVEFYNPHFTDEEIEDQRAEATELGSGRSVL